MRYVAMIATLGICACSPADGADVFEKMNLTDSQRKTAEALIEGQLAASVIPVMRQREYLYAGCYAKRVEMPASYEKAHRAYLANFTEADNDYYGFFAKHGLGEEAAYSVFERYEAADKQCSGTGLLDRLSEN